MTASVIMVGLFAVSSGKALIRAGFFFFSFIILFPQLLVRAMRSSLFLESASHHPGLAEAFQRSTGMV